MKNLIIFLEKYCEVVGFIAAFLVLVSFVMKDIKLIRIISLISAVFFVIYGLLINSYTVWILNSFLIAVQIYFLIKMNLDSKNGVEEKNDELKK